MGKLLINHPNCLKSWNIRFFDTLDHSLWRQEHKKWPRRHDVATSRKP